MYKYMYIYIYIYRRKVSQGHDEKVEHVVKRSLSLLLNLLSLPAMPTLHLNTNSEG